jgi:Flp pilus assembly protein TadG
MITAALKGWRDHSDSGNAVIEFVFIALVAIVPLSYLIVSVASVQRSSLAVTQAARAAGRAIANASSVSQGLARAEVAVRISLQDQHLPTEGTTMRIVGAAEVCQGATVEPSLASGAEFAVCVVRRAELPGVPTLVAGRGVTTVGRFVVHMDEFRSGR